MQQGWAMLSLAHLLEWWVHARTSFWLVPAIGRNGNGPNRAALLRLAEQAGEDGLRAEGNGADRARLADAVAAARAALDAGGPAPEPI